MNNRPVYAFVLLLLAVLAGASLWLDMMAQSGHLTGLLKGARTPDYMVNDFSMSRTGIQGNIIYTLNAQSAAQYAEDDSTTLTLPHLQAQDAVQGSVDIRSDRAWVASKAKQVNFYGHVVLVRDLHDGNGPTTLYTDYLEAFPDSHLLRTSHPVRVESATLHMTAGGLQLNQLTRQLWLSRRVRAQYQQHEQLHGQHENKN